MKDRSQKLYAQVESDGTISGYKLTDKGAPSGNYVLVTDAVAQARVKEAILGQSYTSPQKTRLKMQDGKVAEKPKIGIVVSTPKVEVNKEPIVISLTNVPEGVETVRVRVGAQVFDLGRDETLEVTSRTAKIVAAEVIDPRFWSEVQRMDFGSPVAREE